MKYEELVLAAMAVVVLVAVVTVGLLLQFVGVQTPFLGDMLDALGMVGLVTVGLLPRFELVQTLFFGGMVEAAQV